ncbi:MAG: hypothetical protein GF398_14705 [Chitinivibrionales bacterium]|nr:hypothetical protein [Chitinivibrionales bacterium]
MDYMECEVKPGDTVCLDLSCSCKSSKLPRGTGYLFISEECVEFRRHALSREALQSKLAPLLTQGNYIPFSNYEPLLLCEIAARSRNLDLPTAAQDAQMWWESSQAPLRHTPKEGEVAAALQPIDEAIGNKPAELPQASIAEQSEIQPQISTAEDVPGESHASSQNTADASDTTPGELTGGESNEASAVETDQPAEAEVSESDTNTALNDLMGGPLSEFASKMAKQSGLGTTVHGDEDSGPAAQQPVAPTPTPTVMASSASLVNEDWSAPRDDVAAAEYPNQPGHTKKKGISGVIVGLSLAVIAVMGAGVWIFLNRAQLFSGSESSQPVRPVTTFETVDEFGSYAPDESDESTPVPADEPQQDEKAVVPEAEPEPAPGQGAEAELQKQEDPATEITSSFFQTRYKFTDKSYAGSIEFSNVSSLSGSYAQIVHAKGSTKQYNVRGTFTYTNQRIIFAPRGAKTTVTWQIEKLDGDAGNAVFFDPNVARRADGRILLIRE